jgi:hypothetical protein
MYVSSYYYVCVLILLYVSSYYYMFPHTNMYVSSYYYICVLILLYMRSRTPTCAKLKTAADYSIDAFYSVCVCVVCVCVLCVWCVCGVCGVFVCV